MLTDIIKKNGQQIKSDLNKGLLFFTKKYFGVLTILIFIALQELTPLFKLNMNINCSLFGLIVIFSIYLGGVLPGIISSFVVILYGLFSQANITASSIVTNIGQIDYKIAIISIIIMAILVGIMDQKYKKYYEKYKENQSCTSWVEEISDIMVTYTSVNGKFLMAPKKFCSYLGYSEEELITMKIWDISHIEDAKKEEKLFEGLLKGLRPSYSIEKRTYKKNGEIKWFYKNAYLVKYDDGSIKYVFNYIIDITERKRMEEKIKNHSDFLQKIIDTIPNPIFIKKSDSEYIDFNKSFADLIGSVEKKIKVRDFVNDLNMDIIKEILEHCEKAIELNTSLEYNFAFKNLSYKGKGEIDGTYIINTAPYMDMDKNINGVVGSITNISHLKKIEEELKQINNKYGKLLELSPDVITIINKGIITFINDSGAKMLGYQSPNELIGKEAYKFVAQDNIEEITDNVKWAENNLNTTGKPYEIKFKSNDSKFIDVESINIGYIDGEEVSVMTVARDITERKKAEALKKEAEVNLKLLNEAIESDKIKNEFFANVSHELRTPLNVMMGVLQLLTLYKDNKEDGYQSIDRYIKMMKQNCYRLLRLVNNLIDITKIDAGFFNIKLRRYDIVKIVEDITLSIVEYVESNGLILEFDTNEEERIISCDPDQMERIILNLLANSIKFTNPGGKINVVLESEDDSVKIIIRDTGIGIPEDQLEIIFERFKQVDRSFARDCSGSGIGLSLVKSLVEMHGGNIKVKSKEKCGTEFTIIIPVDESKILSEEEVNIKSGGSIDKIKIEFSDIYSV